MKKTIIFIFFLSVWQLPNAQNVGIGTTTPAYKLDVNGRMRVKTGTLGNNSTSSGIWLEDFRNGNNRAFVGMQDSIRVGLYGTGADGVGWGFNFNAVSGDVAVVTGNLGVGTIDPSFHVQLNRSNPSMGFFDTDGDDHFSGSINGDGSDLFINAFRRPNVIPITEDPGNLILQVNGVGPFINSTAGKVAIGITSPDAKLHIANGTNLSLSTGGYLQLGFTDNSNIVFDNTEIQARNDGSAAKLFLQNLGGGLQINSGTGTINITSAGELNRNNITGTANLLPLAFGRISQSGTIINSTGNFTVTKSATGVYEITLSNESNLYTNRANYVILVTPYNTLSLGASPIMIDAGISEDNKVEVRTNKPKVYFVNDSCSETCGPFTYIQNVKFYDEIDFEFSILIYKY